MTRGDDTIVSPIMTGMFLPFFIAMAARRSPESIGAERLRRLNHKNVSSITKEHHKSMNLIKFEGWFLVDGDQFVGRCKKGYETLLSWKKKTGIPDGALSFLTKEHAEREIRSYDRIGMYPLCDLKAEFRTWT
jgi:hypothetical protein